MNTTEKPALVVLAAGMGSRYGGLKQVDSMGPSGECLLDYSVYDAKRAGFGKVVFVIRKDFEDVFKKQVGSKFASMIPVEYVYQDLSDLPEGFSVPEGRSKPWGTAHAIRAARDLVKGPFAAINADDFYGREAFERLARFFENSKRENGSGPLPFAMVGYLIEATLSKHGTVARGICSTTPEGFLSSVTECTKLAASGESTVRDEETGVEVPFGTRVSMNCWGFSAGLFDELERMFPVFLEKNLSNLKSEWYIPFVVDELVHQGRATVKVLPTSGSWFGVTYRDDKEKVAAEILKLVEAGEYPRSLFA